MIVGERNMKKRLKKTVIIGITLVNLIRIILPHPIELTNPKTFKISLRLHIYRRIYLWQSKDITLQVSVTFKLKSLKITFHIWFQICFVLLQTNIIIFFTSTLTYFHPKSLLTSWKRTKQTARYMIDSTMKFPSILGNRVTATWSKFTELRPFSPFSISFLKANWFVPAIARQTSDRMKAGLTGG